MMIRKGALLLLCLSFTIFRTSFTTAAQMADQYARIIESKSSNDGVGNYEFRVRTSDGYTRWQTGKLMFTSDNKPYIHVEGGYSYLDLEFQVMRIVTFVADQNGYRPKYMRSGIFYPTPRIKFSAIG